jgi:hypothetical protein
MQTLGSINAVAALLEALAVGEPLSHGALTVIPLLKEAPRDARSEPDPDWLTLAEAGAAVTITEVSADGEVPTLSLVNDADRPVLLLDGEEFLNTTVLVAAHAALRIPVSCVEQGRWSYRGKRFDSSDASLFASARAKKAARVSTSLRESGRHLSDQGEIWNDVAKTLGDNDVKSATGAKGSWRRRAGRWRRGRDRSARWSPWPASGSGWTCSPRRGSSSGPGLGCAPATRPRPWAGRRARPRPTPTPC